MTHSALRLELGLAAILTLVALLSFGQLLVPGVAPYSPHSDILAAHLTIKQALYDSWQAGHGIPLWRSDLLSGGPGLTHPQTLYTNPFQFLFLFVPAVDAMGPTLWLHYLAMAISYSIFGRALGLDFGPRLFMAIAGLFSFKLIAITYAGWLSVIPIVTMLPLLAAAVLHLIDRPALGSGLWLALVGSLCLHSGHLQLFYYALVFLAPYLLTCAIRKARGGESALGARLVGLALLASLIAGASAAYLMLPLAAEAPLTSRSDVTYEFFLSGREATARDLATFLHPEAIGTPLAGGGVEIWERVAYFGAIPQLLAIAGVLLGRTRRHAPLLIAGFAGSILLAFDSPLNQLLYEVLPGYSLFRGPNRFFFLTSLFGIGLAGIGAAEITRRAFAASPPRTGLRTAPAASIAITVLIALTAAEGTYYARRYIDTASTDFVLPTPKYREFFAADDSIYRVAPLRRATINYGWASGMGIELVTGFEPYNYAHYQIYFDLLRTRIIEFTAPVWTDLQTISRGDLLDALNVEYVASPIEINAPKGYRLEAKWTDEPRYYFYDQMGTGDLYLYRNENNFERAFWARAAVPALDLEHASEIMRTHSLRKTAIVENPALREAVRYATAPSLLAIDKPYSGALRVGTANPNAGFLVISEVWHPGWRATLDGERIEIHRTDVALMGVDVPAGAHLLELDFRPLHWRAALAITALGWSTLGALVLWNWRSPRSR